MSTLDINVLRESIANVTKILSGRGIEVTQRGARAYVRATEAGVPVQVNLPYIPDSATTDLIDAINGFLDHEVGHLLFSDFTAVSKANKLGPEVAQMHNIVEDTFVERSMAKRFRGSASNLENVGHFFLNKYTTPTVNEAIESGEFAKLVGALMVPAIRAWSGQAIYIEYMKDKWSLIEEIANAIPTSLRDRIATVKNSHQSLDVALEIANKLRKEEKPEPRDDEDDEPKKSEKDGGRTGESDEDKGVKGADDEGEIGGDEDESEDDEGEVSKGGDEDELEDDKSDEDDEPEPDEDDEPEPDDKELGDELDDELEDDGESTPAEESSDEEGESAKPSPSESEGGESDEESDAGDDEKSSSPGGTPEADEDEEEGFGSEIADDEPEDEEEEPPMNGKEFIDAMSGSDFDDTVAEEISGMAVDATADSSYIVYTSDFDIIEPFEIDHDYQDSFLTQMEDRVKKMVGPLQKNLERMIVAKQHSRWQPGLRRGKINSGSLYKLKTGDSRVFRKREIEGETKDVAVSLVVDCSGSMSGSRIRIAMESVYAMASVLERIGVAYEVIGFTTGRKGMPHSVELEASEDERKMGRSFSREEPIYMPIFKGFSEQLKVQQKQRFAYAPNKYFLANNIDGESVEYAAQRLLRRPETAKVMFVFSDGQPYAQGNVREQSNHLKATVKKYQNLGIDLFGIGIESTAVEKYYPDYVVLNDVAELPNRVMSQLAKLMLGS